MLKFGKTELNDFYFVRVKTLLIIGPKWHLFNDLLSRSGSACWVSTGIFPQSLVISLQKPQAIREIIIQAYNGAFSLVWFGLVWFAAALGEQGDPHTGLKRCILVYFSLNFRVVWFGLACSHPRPSRRSL